MSVGNTLVKDHLADRRASYFGFVLLGTLLAFCSLMLLLIFKPVSPISSDVEVREGSCRIIRLDRGRFRIVGENGPVKLFLKGKGAHFFVFSRIFPLLFHLPFLHPFFGLA